MPLYEYQCTPCDKIVETYRTIEERRNRFDCPKCGNPMALRISLVATHLWRPLELELETNKPKVYEDKKELQADCKRLNKMMPGLDINT